MSYENLKRIEKELEDYAFEELRNDPEASFLEGEHRYAFLFQKTVQKAAYEIDKAQMKKTSLGNDYA